MPKVNAFIRRKNFKFWQRLTDKSGWINHKIEEDRKREQEGTFTRAGTPKDPLDRLTHS